MEAGTKIKNLVSRLISAEKVAKQMFNDTMALNNVIVDGKLFDYDALSEMAKKDLPLAIETLSKLRKEGVLTDGVMSKLFTNRHGADLSNLLTQINGDVDGFIKRISTGADYTSDAYKNMFNINEQLKQFENQVMATNQAMMKHFDDTATGILLLSNDMLKGFNDLTKDLQGSGLADFFFTIAGSLVTAFVGISSIASIGKILAPLFAPIAGSLSAWLLPITAIITGLTMIAKANLELKKNFADVSTAFDTVPKSIQDAISEADVFNAKIEQTRNILSDANSIPLETGLRNSNILLDGLLSKSKELKDYLDASNNWQTLDFNTSNIQLNNLQESYTKEKENLLKLAKQYQGIREELMKYPDYTGEALAKVLMSDTVQPHLDKSRVDVIREFFKQKDKGITNPEEILEEVYKGVKPLGITKRFVERTIANIDMSGLEKISKAIEESRGVLTSLSDQLQFSTDEATRQAQANLDAYNKQVALIANAQLKEINEIGSTTINNTVYEGVEGLAKIVENAYLTNRDNLIQSKLDEEEAIKASIQKIEDAYLVSNKEMTESDKKLVDEHNRKLKEVIETRKLLESQTDEIAKTVKITKEELQAMFGGIEYSADKTQGFVEALTLLMQTKLTKAFDSANLTKIAGDEKLIEYKIRDLQRLQDKENAQQDSSTRYQLKHISYLKENLQLELQLAKVGASKERQSYLEYKYKIETLKANQELAKSEKQDVREMLSSYQAESDIGRRYINQALSAGDAESIRQLLNSFEKQYSGIMVGEQGRKIKSDYDEIVKYLKAVRAVEEAGINFQVNIKQGLNEIQNVLVSKSLQILSENAIEYVQPYIAQLKAEFDASKTQIAKDFFQGQDFDLMSKIEESGKKIDLLKLIGGDTKTVSLYAKEFKELFGDEIFQSAIESEETLSNLTIEQINENEALLNLKSKMLAITDKETKSILQRLEAYGAMAGLFKQIGETFGVGVFDDIGNVLTAMQETQSFLADSKNNFSFDTIGEELSKGLGANFDVLADQFKNVATSIGKGMSQGGVIGSLVGNITGGGIASQQAGSLAGMVTGAISGLNPWVSAGIQVGASILGGMFGDSGVSQEEAERRTKESNKIYSKNTEALQKLAQNMANLSGGVDGLNNSLISSFSKLPTVGNLNRVTESMTQLWKTMDKTRLFNDVAYQVTKSKKSKGFLGIGGSTTSWTETIELSVAEMLNRYGFKGTIDDMTTDQIRDFSSWLDDYDMGDSDNFSILADALEDYAEALDKMEKNIESFFYDATMESFEGISSLQQEELRQQIETFYKNLGLQIDDEMSAEIDKLAEQMSVMVTIMQDVRADFISSWRTSGVDAGQAFMGAMSPYIDAMLTNISQIYYDVYFSDITKQLEDEFKLLSEKLVELKKKGEDLNWDEVAGELSGSFETVLGIISSTKNETESFNTILLELQKQALESGLSLSDIFDLGLVTETQKTVIDTFKDALTSSEADSAFSAIGDMVGDTIGEALVNKMIDNVMGDKIFEMTAMLDKAVSGNLSFDSLAGLASEAMSVGMMLEGERLRFEAIRDMFDFNKDITYAEQDNSIEYSSGVTSSVTNIYNISSSVEAGNVVEADSVERLADGLLDIILEKLRVERGINLK